MYAKIKYWDDAFCEIDPSFYNCLLSSIFIYNTYTKAVHVFSKHYMVCKLSSEEILEKLIFKNKKELYEIVYFAEIISRFSEGEINATKYISNYWQYAENIYNNSKIICDTVSNSKIQKKNYLFQNSTKYILENSN